MVNKLVSRVAWACYSSARHILKRFNDKCSDFTCVTSRIKAATSSEADVVAPVVVLDVATSLNKLDVSEEIALICSLEPRCSNLIHYWRSE